MIDQEYADNNYTYTLHRSEDGWYYINAWDGYSCYPRRGGSLSEALWLGLAAIQDGATEGSYLASERPTFIKA